MTRQVHKILLTSQTIAIVEISSKSSFLIFTIKKVAITIFAIMYVDKNIYFRDVHVFIERVKDMIIVKSAKKIRNNLYICLRDIALE